MPKIRECYIIPARQTRRPLDSERVWIVDRVMGENLVLALTSIIDPSHGNMDNTRLESDTLNDNDLGLLPGPLWRQYINYITCDLYNLGYPL